MSENGGESDAIVSEDAFAKINLALHVTGQRADGYHLLDMLVTFAEHGDRLEFSPAQSDEFVLSGRFGDVLKSESGTNLVLKARDLLRQAVVDAGEVAPPVRISLQKNLPIASGIGGGSADAAATVRGLLRLWNVSVPERVIDEIALRLGADVPMCLVSKPLVARGIGEAIVRVGDLPSFAMVLANPLQAVSTPEVFRKLATKDNTPLDIGSRSSWLAAIGSMRNDLEQPATAILPVIAEVSAMLKDSGATFVRMSGSGATCFGIFDSAAEAEAAARTLHSRRPDWYFQATTTRVGEQ